MNYNLLSKTFNENILKNSYNLKLTLYFCIMLSIVALIYGSIQGKLLNISGFLITIFISVIVYLFFQKRYKRKIKKAQKKFQKVNKPHLLSKICRSKFRKKNICQKYESAKKNYHKINDLLLKQYQ
jgi:hypothetical protein